MAVGLALLVGASIVPVHLDAAAGRATTSLTQDLRSPAVVSDGCPPVASCGVPPGAAGAAASVPTSGNSSGEIVGWAEVAFPPAIVGAGAGLVANASAGTAYLFGGEVSGALNNSTVQYSESTNLWSPVATTGAPSPRSDFAFAGDPATGVAILFGGVTNVSVLSVANDTWRLDLATLTWTNETAGSRPPAREDPAFALAPSLGIGLLYGGINPDFASTGSITYSDLWELNLTTFAWTELTVAGVHPPPLTGASLAFDPVSGQFELFGGCYPCSSNVWQFNPAGGSWTELNASGSPPAPRGWASWSYDPAIGGLVLFGGSEGGAPFSDTRLFYPANTTWISEVSSPVPPARADAASAFLGAPGNATFLVAGGESGSQSLGDAWRLSATSALDLLALTNNSSRAALAGADVTIGGRAFGSTDRSGWLNMSEVNGVDATLVVERAGFYPVVSTLWLPPGGTSLLQVSLTVIPTGTLKVFVEASNGPPVDGASVNLTVEDGLLFTPGPVSTPANGTVIFYDVPAGVVNVSVVATGYRWGNVSGLVQSNRTSVVSVYLDVDPVLFVAVTGEQPNGTQLPLAEATVLLNGVLLGTTDPEGVVTHSTDLLGLATVLAQALYYEARAIPIVLPWTGTAFANITLEPLPPARADLQAVSSVGRVPIGGAVVVGLPPAAGVTDPAGWWNVSVRGAGMYLVTVSAVGYYTNETNVTLISGNLSVVVVPLTPLPPAVWSFGVPLGSLGTSLLLPALLVGGGLVLVVLLRTSPPEAFRPRDDRPPSLRVASRPPVEGAAAEAVATPPSPPGA
jgi:hypothetical protein